MTIKGYASVFFDPGSQERTEFPLGENYVERIMPGAFDEALRNNQDVVALLNHDPNQILGRRSAGTLRLEVDSKGLRYETSEANTQLYQDVQTWQARGELLGNSFGFQVTSERFARDGEKRVREVHQVILRDVGPVTYPAYSGTEQRDLIHRYVSPEGYACAPPVGEALECRSLIETALHAKQTACERQLVEVRSRAVLVNIFLEGMNR